MSALSKDACILEASGVVRRVDVIGREVEVFVNGISQTFDVPADCPIFLHDDRVKLRLLQTYDHVQVIYDRNEEQMIARTIRANWWQCPPAEIREARQARAAEFRVAASGGRRPR